MLIYDYIFYKLYQFFKTINDDMPAFLAVMLLSWLFFFNTVSISGLILLRNPEYVIYTNKILGGVIGVFILSFHFLYFFTGEKVEKIKNRFRRTNLITEIFGTLGVLLYIFLSSWICLRYIVPKLGNAF